MEWMAGLEPASARRQRAALPLSYTHVDGRRDGIRTRAGLSPDRFAGGRLRLLGHSALAAEEGLEPPIYRLTAGRCARSATPQGPQLQGPRGPVSPARLGRACTAGGSRTRDLLGESQACCRSTTAAPRWHRSVTSGGTWGVLVKRALAGRRTQTSPVPGACSTVELQGLGLPHGRQVKLPSLAGTTRTCGLRLRRAALCPAELRRDGRASREACEAPKRRRQGSNLEHPAS